MFQQSHSPACLGHNININYCWYLSREFIYCTYNCYILYIQLLYINCVTMCLELDSEGLHHFLTFINTIK
jgi:hypothetical protein